MMIVCLFVILLCVFLCGEQLRLLKQTITRHQDEQLAKIMEHFGMHPETSFAVAIYYDPAGL
eukprot:SAG31_NODE_819_length_11811_cov_3.315488_6_plen_62_part_00